MPSLVPMAKVKLNLLSAPLKLVSQDSVLCLPSITSAGTKGRLPEGMKIRAICIRTQAIKTQQSHRDSFHFTKSQLSSKWNAKCHQLSITVFFKRERKKEPSQNANYKAQQGRQYCFHERIWGNIFLPLAHQLSISTLFTNTPAIVLRPLPTVQSVNQSSWITWHSCTKVDFNVLQMSLKN